MTIGRVGVWVCSPTKLKIPKAEQETAQPTAARFNKPFGFFTLFSLVPIILNKDLLEISVHSADDHSLTSIDKKANDGL